MADGSRNRSSSVSKAAQDIADKVSNSLPVRINGEDVESTPEFVNLLKTLSQHLTEDGVSQHINRKLVETQKGLQHEKQNWLQQHILHQELVELLIDSKITSDANFESRQFYSAVHDCLMTAEIGDFLNTNPDTEVTLLGLKKEDVQRRNPHQKHLSAIQQKLIPEVENRLRTRCENLVAFHDSSGSARQESSNLVFARASQLPAVLDTEKRELAEQKRQVKRDRASREKQFWQYYQAIMASLEVLEELILNHRLKSQKEFDKVTSEWLAARCDAMCLKIKLLELQLMCDTYYAETIQALKLIRREIDSATEKTKIEISSASQALKSYESVGLGFDALVREYTYLKDEIDNKKWAIQELKTEVLGLDDAS